MNYKRTMVKLSPSALVQAKARAKEAKHSLGTWLGILVERSLAATRRKTKAK